MQPFDLAVIGAGPAGMAAAAEVAGHGLRVALLDEQAGPGGQIYRGITTGGVARGAVLGRDYLQGQGLAPAVDGPGIVRFAGATVWQVEPCPSGFGLAFSVAGVARVLEAAQVILATGALERAMPLPGWTLPGVMTAGAGQILLKTAGVLPERAVLAGSGPLLYLLAVQMIRAGVPPLAVVDTADSGALLRALPRLWRGWRGGQVLLKGVGLLAALRRSGVPWYRGATGLAVMGDARAEAVGFDCGGRRHRLACATVLLHQGVIPNCQASRSLRLDHVWDEGDRAFRPVTDRWGQSSLPGVFIAGDGAGISGATAAEAAGRVAALAAVCRAGRMDAGARDRAARAAFARLSAERSVRPFLNAAYAPGVAYLRPHDAVTVCRCEEVTAGAVRGWASLGCLGPNQTKAFGRVGMGPCQGRYCGPLVTELLAERLGKAPQEVGYFRIRPPIKPVTLGELAAMEAKDG